MGVYDSHAYRKMDVTRERISLILEIRKILLSFQTGFNLVNTAVACAVEPVSLDNSSNISLGLEPRAVSKVLSFLSGVGQNNYSFEFIAYRGCQN